MRGSTLAAIVLILAGVIALAYQGFTYTTHKQILNMGPIQATKEEHHTVYLPPVLGIVALVGGIAILAFDKRGS